MDNNFHAVVRAVTDGGRVTDGEGDRRRLVFVEQGGSQEPLVLEAVLHEVDGGRQLHGTLDSNAACQRVPLAIRKRAGAPL